jgi:hypothetical protein
MIQLTDRIQLIDDSFYLANNQHLSITTALDVLEYIVEEDHFLPWKYAIKHIKKIIMFIEDDSAVYAKFRVTINT